MRHIQIIIFRDHTYPHTNNVTFEVVDNFTQYTLYEFPICSTIENIKERVLEYIDELNYAASIEITQIL